MPLLNKKNFVINDPPPNLRDDEEVFYSELTNEIFRDYEEFCERIFLCNSLVWSCSYTGRSSLTYQEAVNTEQVAKKMLNEFPLKLRIPVLYLTTLTERSSLIEFAEDVFAFARDRYFIGEEVEVDFTNDTWTDCRIIKVQYPTQKQLQELNQQSQKTKSGERDYWPPAGLYSYEVEEAGGDRHTVAADKVRRRKNVYTREKNRLYIKQFVERQGSVWKLKKSVYLKYGIDKVKFDMIFCGPAMVSLAPSKKKPVVKKPAKDPTKKEVEKQKVQGSIDKYFAKKSSGEKLGNSGDTNNSKKPTPKKPAETPQKTLVQKLKNKYKMNAKNNGKVLKKPKDIKTEKTEKLPRGRKKKEVPEKKALTKDELQKLAVECKDKDVKEKFAFLKKNNLTKEEKVQVLELVKEYTKFREDLECSSLKELPAPLPIQMRLPNELFGDFLHMLEFFNAFSNVVSVRDFFSGGITFELLERALVEKEVAGPLSDVIHVLLVTLFELQDQEEDLDDKLSLHSGSGESVKNEKLNPLMNLRLAVAAATYSQQYHGHPISELTLDSASITEVLRLHILASGRRLIDESDSRGPIMTVEDPCSELCLRHPNLLNELSQKSIFELPIEDKVLIINSLINQILSFASIKESIEEELENLKLARVELRSKRAAEVKRIKEAEKELKEQQKAAVGDKEKDKDKSKENKEKEKEKGEAAAVQGEGGDGEEVDTAPKTRLKLDKNLVLKARELAQLELRVQCQPLGMDRAYRRYWLFYSTPGLFVEDNEPFPGTCVPRDVIDSLSADSPLKYVRRLFDGAADDKENLADGGKTGAGAGRTSIGCSPSKKLLAEKNGDAIAPMLANIKVEQPDKVGLMCTGDAVMCPIHGAARPASWSFYKDEADLNALIEGLSKYGVRESQLRKELVKNKQRILDSVKRCPHYKLNPSIPEDPEQLEIKKSTKSGPKYLNPHLDFPPDTPIDEILISSLRYMILETEEKIFAGHIGKLKVKDRTAWRDALNDKSYDRQCDELSWGPKKGKNLTEVSSDESEDNKEAVNSISQSSAASDKIERLMRADVESPKKEVLDLACAILQIEQAIEHRFLKKPFGIADCKEKDKEKAEIKGYKLRERWESSLMASCSISQLFVHIYSLDNHIAWSRSALKALCRVCRRASNPESMLLCDMCNKGHHMSCLKPPLKKVPEGDWFCPRCVPKPTPVKRSRKENMDVDESDAEACRMLGRCKTCKSEGELVMCDSCESGWHFDCINPPLRKQPRSKWTCAGCRQNSKRDEASVSPGEVERSSRRRCAKAATAKISHFAKQLRTQAWDDSGSAVLDEDERADDSNRRRSSRRESAAAAAAAAEANSCSVLRSDLPLDNAALQEMLDALMHHKDAWPFLRPVTKAEVPDYRTIIKKPMDFGTIKHKLNMLEYSKNSQVIADALLVFDNCYTYNQPESEVFKAGERLQKMFEKLCSERKMNIDVDYEVRPPDQKKPKLN